MNPISKESVVKNERLREEFLKIDHPSGLTIYLYPMKGYSSAYALFGTNYGSIDTTFKTQDDPDFVTVPEGIAHFLEHKLFESEDGDAFTLFAATGASANAFTSFDRTCYLFSTTDNFEQSLDALLTFVQSPYFTKETVEKEQGIIGQEIRMYDDAPDWRVFFNLLGALYHNHPVRIDIAGTTDSIAQIDDQLLYRCYHTFYNLSNMTLAVTGNFDLETAKKVIERRIPTDVKKVEIQRKTEEEPLTVVKNSVEQDLEVAVPLFHIGFKEQPLEGKELLKTQVTGELLLELIAGEGSSLYRELYDEGLINAEFGTEVMTGRGYYCEIFAGESRDPKAVYEKIKQELRRLKEQGIQEAEFERARKLIYGRYVRGFNDVENVAGALVSAHFMGVSVYDAIEIVAALSFQDVVSYLNTHFDEEHSAISVVNPRKA